MLRPKHAVLALICAATIPFVAAGTAAAQGDRDCRDFATQADAQAALDSRVGDPEHLDGDHDGQACESYFGTVGASAPRSGVGTVPEPESATPRGGVEAGDGTVPEPDSATPLIAGLLAVAAVAGGISLTGRRRSGAHTVTPRY